MEWILLSDIKQCWIFFYCMILQMKHRIKEIHSVVIKQIKNFEVFLKLSLNNAGL